MKNTYILCFIAAALFAAAAVLNFINGVSYIAIIGCIGAISFLLAGIHWRRRTRK